MVMGTTAENTNVTDVMSGEIVKFSLDESLKEAARTMNSKRNRLLVFDEDRMIGIVTATDNEECLHSQSRIDAPTSNGLKRIPMTRDEAIVGIITAKDLVEAFANS